MENITPTPQQDELFHLTVRNFINTAKSHWQVLAKSHLALAHDEIDKWVQGQNLPTDMPRRVQIMDFIWTHYCNCKCN